MIKKYKKKPIVVSAIQWNGTYLGIKEIERLFPKLHTTGRSFKRVDNTVEFWRIQTLEGSMEVSKDDHIIRGIHGEFYPCKPDIFEKTYDEES